MKTKSLVCKVIDTKKNLVQFSSAQICVYYSYFLVYKMATSQLSESVRGKGFHLISTERETLLKFAGQHVYFNHVFMNTHENTFAIVTTFVQYCASSFVSYNGLAFSAIHSFLCSVFSQHRASVFFSIAYYTHLDLIEKKWRGEREREREQA